MRNKIKLIRLQNKAGVRDYSRAAARMSPVMKRGVNHANDDYADEPWLGHTSDDSWMDSVASGDFGFENSIGESGAPTKTFGETSVGSFINSLGGLFEKITGVDKSAVPDILAGLSQDYINDCVRRYNAGQSMSDFDRRVAEAYLKLKGYAINKGKQLASDWIMDHLPEIGLGVLGVIVLITLLVRK